MEFVAFDLETTGTVAGVDQIVEIGVVRYKGLKVVDRYSALVNPRRPMPQAATHVNGITDEMLVDQPHIEDLLAPLAHFCQNLPLVAHNAPFDMQFLKADILKHEIPGPSGVIIDTLPMARRAYPGLPNYKLATLAQHLKFSGGTYHRAQEDAVHCGDLFNQILRKIFTPGETFSINNLVALTGRPEMRFPLVQRRAKQLSLAL